MANIYSQYDVSSKTIQLLNSNYVDDDAQKFLDEQLSSGMKTSIEYTERIYKSKLFFECLSNAVNLAIRELSNWKNIGALKRSSPIARIWLRGDLNPHYLLSQGTIIHFHKSKLPKAERDTIQLIFNSALDDYRRVRNAEQRATRKVNAIKKKLEKEGITNITVRKYGTTKES